VLALVVMEILLIQVFVVLVEVVVVAQRQIFVAIVFLFPEMVLQASIIQLVGLMAQTLSFK
jgi:hypothetical protein